MFYTFENEIHFRGDMKKYTEDSIIHFGHTKSMTNKKRSVFPTQALS